jgi:hypothetical protein
VTSRGRRALAIAAALAVLAAGAVLLALRLAGLLGPASIAGRPEVGRLRTARDIQVVIAGQREFTLSAAQAAELADLVAASVDDRGNRVPWKPAGQAFGLCASGGQIWLAFSEGSEFAIWWKSDDGKRGEELRARARRSIRAFLMDCRDRRN